MKKVLLWSISIVSLVLVGTMAMVAYQIYDYAQPVRVVALTTEWTNRVDPDRPLPAYPRPQLRRDDWANLNGRWQYAITKRGASQPKTFDGEIIVPFAIESLLSGVEQPLLPDQRLWYRRVFDTPPIAPSERLLLHFGAVDWEAEVWLNGARLGRHQGGYDPFTFDITESIAAEGQQELIVAVWDPTNLGPGAYGKQHLVPHGIRYTAVSGIWQTVWLEPVSASRIDAVVSSTNLAEGTVYLRVHTTGASPGDRVVAMVFERNGEVAHGSAVLEDDRAVLRMAPDTLRTWSPDDPFLYEVELRLLRNGETLDAVRSYFGAREIAISKDELGISRLFLNGRPVFQLGLLDQGWWPDGLYTAPTDEALSFDIESTRLMGFNTIRKHVKVEPARWYWHADRLGLLVWQDMPTGDGGDSRYAQVLRQAWDIIAANTSGQSWRSLSRPTESAALFEKELGAMMAHLEPFPSIVSWVPYNEGWGQFDTDRIVSGMKQRDPERLVDGPSGWFDTGSGDMVDLHVYGREAAFVDALPHGRALVYGEFGGIGLPVAGHLSVDSGWGYTAYENEQAYREAYNDMLALIEQLIPRGLAGAIYTQTTDVESEINGLMTYDRRFFKISPVQLSEINQRVVASGSDLTPRSTPAGERDFH